MHDDEDIIKKLILSYKSAQNKSAIAWQSEGSTLVQDVVIPAFEKVFPKYRRQNIRLGKIELTVNPASRDDMIASLTGQLEAFLRDAQQENRRSTKREEITEILFIFLETGNLPWFISASRFHFSKWLELWLDENNTDDASGSLLSLLVRSPQARIRLAAACSPKLFTRVLSMLFKDIEKVERHWLVAGSDAKVLPAHLFWTLEDRTHWMEVNFPVLAGHFHKMKPEQGISQREFNPDFAKKPVQEQAGAPQFSPEIPSGEHFRIGNAGLVLLSPFLPAIFHQLGYCSESGNFYSRLHRHRAVHLLFSLTGLRLKHEEQRLLIGKILCGLHPYEVVLPAFRLKKIEKREIDGLLESVLEHWQALKSTSVAGLQEAFLRRQGSLERSGEEWIVRVDTHGMDVLLSSIPWSFNILSFPWIDYRILVEWR